MNEVSNQFPNLDDILWIHADTIHHEGGQLGVRDFGLLEWFRNAIG